MPDEVQFGTWCSNDEPSECFAARDIAAKYPDAVVTDVDADSVIPFATQFKVCLQGEGSKCDNGTSRTYLYLPAWTGWDCATRALILHKVTACDPDYTGDHHVYLPRLLYLFQHQAGGRYEDSPPMYQREGD